MTLPEELPDAPETPQRLDDEPPRWLQLLLQYREQLLQIDEWLQVEPTEEEMADGSALQKAFTLMSAKDELSAKIEQLEAIASQEGYDPQNLFAGPDMRDARSNSFVSGAI